MKMQSVTARHKQPCSSLGQQQLNARPVATASRHVAAFNFAPSARTSAALVAAAPSMQQPPLARGCSRQARLAVVCMAHPRRVAKVSSAIQRELSQMFIYDPVLVNAITPERRTGGDEVSALASITHVYVSNDLQVVKVYVSVYSDDLGKRRAMDNLRKLEGYVRREMSQRVVLRLTPEYRFEYDDSLEEAELVARVIGEEDVARYQRELDEEAGITPQQGQQQQQGDEEAGGFFDDEALQGDGQQQLEEEDEGEYEEYSSKDIFGRPGPFDDLFAGDDDEEEEVPQRRKGSKKGSRKSSRKALYSNEMQEQEEQQPQGAGNRQ